LQAILSDVHGNLAALEAVLDDLYARKVTRVLCLGDLVGYGPQPVECLELASKFDIVLKGNHEEAVLTEAVDFNIRAGMAVNWTRERLASDPGGEKRMILLRGLPEQHVEEDKLLVHGSPREPTREYIFPGDARDAQKMAALFERFERFCFVGHTHVPGVFTEGDGFAHPTELLKNIFLFEDEKAIINVGSVGQPRDNDPRACYVTFDGDSVVFRRVKYDVDKTADLIYKSEGLAKSLGDRLKVGK